MPKHKRSDREMEREHLAFLQSHFPEVAATASAGYQSWGRGAVVVLAPRRRTDLVTMLYLPDEGALPPEVKWPPASGRWPDAVTARMVKTYNTQTQMVAVFVERDSTVHAYKFHAMPAPSLAGAHVN